MIDLYSIPGTSNLDSHESLNDPNTFPDFQDKIGQFKSHIIQLVDNHKSATFYKFGDGDYRFLKKQEIGSASPGKRALSKSYDDIQHERFVDGASKCDFYTCEIYPQNRAMFRSVIDREIDYPAEYGYGLVANKWLFQQFKGRIGVIGAHEKLLVIEELLKHEKYQDYLGLESFCDYIHFPQKYAADDIDLVEEFVGNQLKESTADIFLVGIGHAKSALLHTLPKYKSAVYLDVGAGIDMIAGCINTRRPYAGDWSNYRLKDYDYSTIDYLKYNRQNEIML